MKGKIPKILSVGLALVLALSLSLVMAVPVSASHTSSATVAFTEGQSTMQGEASSLDVEVTNPAVGSLGNITEVVIDFTETDFTVTGTGDPAGWTGTESPDDVITYTHATGIAPGDSVIFVPAVDNPPTIGVATNPTVTTTDAGSKAELEATEDTGWIGYIADAIGTAGNNITVEYADAAPYSALIVSVVGSAISVELADDGTDPTSTVTEVADAINGDTAASALVIATADSEHLDDLVLAMSATALSGGSLAMVDKPCPVTGVLEVTELLLTVTVTPTPATSASLASYVISFPTIVVIAAETGWITITFPAGYDLALVVAADVTVEDDTVAYTTGAITAVGQVVTIPAGTLAIAADSVVEITIANDHVENPPASGDYDIAVTTSGDDTGDGEVTIIPASFGVVAGTDDTVIAGTAFAVTVTALNDESEPETDIGYTGDHFIDFTSTGAGTIPAFELITFTAGVGTSPPYFVLTDATETPTITATDEDGVTGTSDVITIDPATFVKFTIAGEANKTAGIAQGDITVTAQDADGNTVTDYTGTVTWSSSDDDAVLPAAYTFTTGDGKDNGVHIFLGTSSLFILKTAGTQTITVTDVAAEVSEESADITVTPAAAASIVVAASPGVIEADGTDSSTITVTAKDEFGNVATGFTGDQSITIASSLGAIAAANPSFTLGEATTTLTSDDELGTATIRVEHATFDDTMTTVKLLADIGITTITVTVDKGTILNNGVDVRTITATYTDGTDIVTAADGADYTVTFTTDVADPDEVTLNPADGVVVPVAGVATVTLTATAASETTIAVTADGTGADDGSGDITVTESTYSIDLVAGWNLISLPLVPDSSVITDVLSGLIAAETVDWVDTFVYELGLLVEKKWDPPAILQNTQINDGQGYWINMFADDTLTISGLELPAPPNVPPTYLVYEGWNLIGFKSLDTATTAEGYLGTAVTPTLEVMYGYAAATGLYEVVQTNTNLVPGHGYWLAVSANGTIYP